MKTVKKVLLLMFCAVSLSPNVCLAGTVAGFGGATEFTQLLNNFQLGGIQIKELIQVQNQLHQLNNMIINGLTIPDQIWGQTQDELIQLARIVREGQALAYSAANIDDEFRQRFKDYQDYLSDQLDITQFSQKYEDWAKTNLDTIKSALKSANYQYEEFTTEERTLSLLQRQSETAQGRMQAIQVGNQIAAQQVRQMQKLRSLLMSQMQMQGAFMATQTEEKSVKKAQNARFYKAPNVILGNEERF